MKKLSGAEMVVQSLRDQGVEFLFGYPGGAVLDIYDAIHTLGGIEHILVRHEAERSEERRVGKECRSRWSPYH